jgi:hypothetical protein
MVQYKSRLVRREWVLSWFLVKQQLWCSSLRMTCFIVWHWVLCTEVRYVWWCDHNIASWRCSCCVHRLCVFFMYVFLIVIWLIWLYVHYIVIVMHVLCWSGPNLFPTRFDGTAISCPNSWWWDNSASPQFLHQELSFRGFVTLRAQNLKIAN